jgi:hypothetical protein
VVLEAAIAAIERRSGNQVGVRLRTPASEREVDGSDLLVAVGRTPNTRGIGLESAGVELDLRGNVKVNERLETTAPGVWAMGECAGSPQFTPVVSGWCATISADDSRSTDPLLHVHRSRVGAGRARGGGGEAPRDCDPTRTLPMNSVLRARTIGETCGFMKALIDARSDRILVEAVAGCRFAGPRPPSGLELGYLTRRPDRGPHEEAACFCVMFFAAICVCPATAATIFPATANGVVQAPPHAAASGFKGSLKAPIFTPVREASGD